MYHRVPMAGDDGKTRKQARWAATQWLDTVLPVQAVSCGTRIIRLRVAYARFRGRPRLRRSTCVTLRRGIRAASAA